MIVVRGTLTLEVITDNTNDLKEKTIILAQLNRLSLKEKLNVI